MGNFPKVFLIILLLLPNLKLMSAFHSWKVFSYKLETFKNCKEVQHVMIMIIAIIYIFWSHMIFDQQLKINFRKLLPPFFLTPPPLKIRKLLVPPPFFFAKIEKFLDPPPCRKGRGGREYCVLLSLFKDYSVSAAIISYIVLISIVKV